MANFIAQAAVRKEQFATKTGKIRDRENGVPAFPPPGEDLTGFRHADIFRTMFEHCDNAEPADA
jgi:hypothetical protein